MTLNKLIIMKILTPLLLLISLNSYAQFDKVSVKMQSGETVKLMDLPWFKWAKIIYEGRHSDKATTAQWVITAPPQHCPYGISYWVQWNGNLGDKETTEAISACNKSQKSKLTNLTESVQSACNCSIILKSNKVSNIFSSENLWTSLNDKQLLAKDFKFKLDLVSKNELIPVILAISPQNLELFDFKGNKLCMVDANDQASFSDEFSSSLKNVSFPKKPIKISCLSGQSGFIDTSQIEFNKLLMRHSGDGKITFTNGEKYVLLSE